MTAAALRNPYVFVVGCPRSGTTLLQRVLDSHPDLAVVNEAQFVPRVLDDRGLDAGATLTPAMVAEARSYRRFQRLELPDDAVEQAAARSSTYREFVSALFDAVAAARGKRKAGEKMPDYVRFLPLLGDLFPDARFVHLIRDGRDVTLSLLNWARGGKGPGRYLLWGEDPVGTSALWWAQRIIEGRRDGAALGPRYQEVCYEDLVRDTEGVARELAGFLDLPYAREMVRFHEGRQRHDPALSAKDAWLPPTAGLRDWRRDMHERDVELFEAIGGDVLSSLGYERAFPQVSTAMAARARELAGAWAAEQAPRAKMASRRRPPPTAGVLEALRDLGYTPTDDAFAVGRPDRPTVALTSPGGVPCVAKLYDGDDGEPTFANMREVWASSFGARRSPPGLPEPLAYIRAAGALVMRRVDGRPMAELDPATAADLVDDAIDLLLDLHTSDAHPPLRRDARGVVRAARRKLREVADVDDALGDRFARVVSALESARPDAVPLVPSHGDFSARNVLVGDGGLVLIDWDRVRLAEPARDATYFGLWEWADALTRRDDPSWATLERALDVYDAREPERRVRDRAEFYIAAGLARVAHAMVMIWKRDADTVAAVLDEALRQLA